MSNFINSMTQLRTLDSLAKNKSFIHLLNPFTKLITTILVIYTIISFNKYEIAKQIPIFLYPLSIILISNIPIKTFFKRLLWIMPIVLVLLLILILDTYTQAKLFSFVISDILLLIISIIIKSILTTFAIMLLIATTEIERLAICFRKLYFPQILILQFLLTYRYFNLLIEEMRIVYAAHKLRSPKKSNIFKCFQGAILGQILVRSYMRAQNIYQAMRLRGFSGEFYTNKNFAFGLMDIMYLLFWSLFLFMIKYTDFMLAFVKALL
ncbi:MAG TPA: energy-coupling factor transporter transmembrane component T [Burkholderiales bacterium]|nr:energy-coupling factor transporter transmembrane component T [Burkholderiales bacterium]